MKTFLKYIKLSAYGKLMVIATTFAQILVAFLVIYLEHQQIEYKIIIQRTAQLVIMVCILIIRNDYLDYKKTKLNS